VDLSAACGTGSSILAFHFDNIRPFPVFNLLFQHGPKPAPRNSRSASPRPISAQSGSHRACPRTLPRYRLLHSTGFYSPNHAHAYVYMSISVAVAVSICICVSFTSPTRSKILRHKNSHAFSLRSSSSNTPGEPPQPNLSSEMYCRARGDASLHIYAFSSRPQHVDFSGPRRIPIEVRHQCRGNAPKSSPHVRYSCVRNSLKSGLRYQS
jgi:hypothetical protein